MSSSIETGIVRMRTNYAHRPIGIEWTKPRFSWALSAPLLEQTAYQIQVAASSFDKGIPGQLVWDSGKVTHFGSAHILYDGVPLLTDTKYYWRVRIWDQNGRSSQWSAQEWWSTGLAEQDWTAQWIGLAPEPSQPADELAASSKDLSAVRWIVQPESARQTGSGDMYAGEMTYFKCDFEVPQQHQVTQAWLCGTGDCRPVAYLNGVRAATSYHYRYPSWVEVTEYVKQGKNTLTYMVNNSQGYGVGESFAALAASLSVRLDNGELLRWHTDETWYCATAQVPDWIHGASDSEAWMPAEEAARFEDERWDGPYSFPPLPLHPSRNEVYYARKSFTLSAPVRRATLYATALGVYRAYANGRLVDDQVLAPGWTDYRERVMVQAYDITALLQTGDNVLGVTVAPGWYAGCVAMFGPYQYGVKPYAIAQLHIECEDGSVLHIVSDETWTASRGAIRFADLLQGEIYDAREELPGWNEPGRLGDSNWEPVVTAPRTALGGRLIPQIGPAARVVAELAAVSIQEPESGVYVIDFGQNLAGWARLRTRGRRNESIRIRYAEMLNEDGTVYVTNLRSARSTDVYIRKSEAEELYEPSMTFHGFQFIEVSGLSSPPKLDDFTACAIASDTPQAGLLNTSDSLINQLYSNIVWGQRGNFLSVPTDCPQRDERLGWTGDAHIFAQTAAYNMEVASFFAKWMRDVADAQLPSGAVTNVAPQLGWLEAGIAGWGEAAVIVPWTIWKRYGDQHILEENYELMSRHMNYLRESSDEWLRPDQGFGDWLSIDADTPKDLLGTAYFAYCAKLMQEIAAALHLQQDVQQYRAWFEAIRARFNEAYVNQDSTLKGDTQTAYVLALHMELLPEERRAAAAAHLVADINRKDEHLSTGFIGVSYLLPVLTDFGYTELAYRLLQRESFPSWLYSVRQGATTIWERWNGWTKEEGFYSAVMNSFNHYSLGSVGEWMFRYMAGIETDLSRPDRRCILLKPVPGGTLTFVEASYETLYGVVRSAWSVQQGRIIYEASVPPNTEAELRLPTSSGARIWSDPAEANDALQQSGVMAVAAGDGSASYLLQPGSYTFVWRA